MSHPLVDALEHPFIIALQRAGLATQAAAQELQRGGAVPLTRSQCATLMEAMLLDQRGVAGRLDRRYLVTSGLAYRMKSAVVYDHGRLCGQLTDAYLDFTAAERWRIIEALAAGAGAALAEECQGARRQRARAIEFALASDPGTQLVAPDAVESHA